jgi:hypothetical protein
MERRREREIRELNNERDKYIQILMRSTYSEESVLSLVITSNADFAKKCVIKHIIICKRVAY